jgi:L-fuculose-phosphate aldolase
LANHGTVSFGESVERAYWWTEVLDSYCRILILARQLGPIQYLSTQKTQELLDLKKGWGFTDPRLAPDFKGDIRDNATFRHTWKDSGVDHRAIDPPNDSNA